MLQIDGQPKTESVTSVQIDGSTAIVELKSKRLVQQCIEDVKQVSLYGNTMTIGEAMDIDVDLNTSPMRKNQTHQPERRSSYHLKYTNLEEFMERLHKYRDNVIDYKMKDIHFTIDLRFDGPRSEVQEAEQYFNPSSF